MKTTDANDQSSAFQVRRAMGQHSNAAIAYPTAIERSTFICFKKYSS
ncbi:hypothetical protein SAMN04488109_5462 [Chryseolinea serpens]|uniref:Uncharacterized protein n=1 Tax=Chryseolinea serpens TaxID=947013 RepID=A0A1M5VW87_9BACT|nr:hypothetical protein SAMN04488109_5462 [Chryseolinea serpens]